MASIAWSSGFPVIQAPNGIVGQCDYALGDGQSWAMAELIANRGTQEYSKQMTRDKPMAGQCVATINGLPPGKYDVTGKLYYNDGTGQHIINTTVVQITV